MTIINRDYHFFVNSDGSVDPRHSGEPVNNIYDWSDNHYWMIEFIHSESFRILDLEKIAGEPVYKGFKDGLITLVLVHTSEAYHYVVEDFYQILVIKQKIPIENIILVTNSADIDLEIEIVAKKYNLPKLKSFYMTSYEYGAKGDLERYPEECVITTLVDKEYDKKFLSLNGLWRPHRMLLGSFLKGLNILDKGYVSLNCVPCDFPPMDQTFQHMLDWCKNNIEGQTLLLNNEEEIKSLPRIYLDEITSSRPAYTCFDKSYYENTYFSIVTETLAWTQGGCSEGNTIGRALSEKTFKPILFKHPFLLIAIPGSLQLLRDLGYKTFSDCIDESYDNEPDDSKRVYMVAKEAERLCNLSSNELKKFLAICRHITNYNLEVLKNKQIFMYKKT